MKVVNDFEDEEARYVIDWCKAINATVHLRGDDTRITIDVYDRTTKRRLNDVAIARRMEKALENGNK